MPKSVFLSSILLALIFYFQSPLEGATLRAGAAKIDITPAEDAGLSMQGYDRRNMTGVHDPIYVRALVLEDDAQLAAVITADIIGFTEKHRQALAASVQQATGIPTAHILFVATHTHSAPTPSYKYDEATGKQNAWTRTFDQAVIEAAQQAQQRLQPASIGYGTGRVNVNMNRRARLANGGWWLGINPDGPSDKTVAVVSITNDAGEPIAILTNYAVHATVMGPDNFLVTGDIAGTTSRFVETWYGGDTVCLWTSAAGGDQRPIYTTEPEFGGRIGPVAVQGQMLGEETVRVADDIRPLTKTPIRTVQQVVSLPGRKQTPGPRYRPDLNFTFLDDDPVQVRLSLLMIGNIALTGVSGEVLVMINSRLKEESPYRRTMMMTHCNGSSGYLCDDAAYDQLSYEIAVTHVKPGYAEDAIVGSLLKMMDEAP